MKKFDDSLVAWNRSLSGLEKRDLHDCGVGSFLGLRQVKLEVDFLDACLKFSDPRYHVFRFHDGEVCPLVEEFSAIMGWHTRQNPVVLRTELGYKTKFSDFLMLTRSEVDHLFVGSMVSLNRLLDKFMDKKDRTISFASKRRALSFCLIVRHAFVEMVDDSLMANPRFLVMVEQMELGRNPAHLLLAETIVGLDDRHVSKMHEYKGCPRLLQVWLMERFGALVPMERAYSIGSLTSRRLNWALGGSRPNGYFEDYVRLTTLRWVISWWNITEFSGSSVLTASKGLPLCALELGLHIHPLRVRRQMGLAQTIPSLDTKIQASKMLTGKMIDEWESMWASRAIWKVPNPRETVWVSRAYVRWTTSENARANKGFRKDEEVDIRYHLRKAQHVDMLEMEL